MKTYEEFLVFLDDHLRSMTNFIPATHKDFHSICYATGRFLLSEPYRWEQLLANWPVTPEDPPKISNEELRDYFTKTKGMPLSFRKELKENDYQKLQTAYNFLFHLLIGKDEFLTAVFRDEIVARRFKRILKQKDKKLKRVLEFLNSMKGNEAFLELMRKFTKDLSGFSLTLINNKHLLDQAIKKIEGKTDN